MRMKQPRFSPEEVKSQKEITLRPYQEPAYEKMCQRNGYLAGLADMRT